MKKSFPFWLGAVFVAALSVLSGCSTLIKSADRGTAIGKNQTTAEHLAASKPARKNLIESNSGFYVNQRPIRISDRKAELLRVYPDDLVVVSKEPMTLQQIADKLVLATGIQVTFIDTAQQTGAPAPSGGVDSASAVQRQMGGVAGLNDLPSFPEAFKDFEIPGFPSLHAIDVQFRGKLPDFLDQAASRLNLFWRYEPDDRRIVFYKRDTQVFTVLNMPGSIRSEFSLDNRSSISAQANNTGGGSSTQASSGQTVELSSTLKTWDDIQNTIKTMLGANGRMYTSESQGTVTVTDSPMVLREVGKYIDEINRMYSRQVTFNVEVYNVEIDNANDVGIDWNVVWNKVGDYAVSYAALSGLTTANSITGTLLKPNQEYTGSKAIIKALETQGRVSLVTSHEALTVNNMPVPVKVADETTYLASSSASTLSSGVGATATTQLTPGKVVTGLTMTLLPKILDANQMMLQFAMDLSQLKEIATITSGTQSIQAPKVSSKSFIQRVAMRSNETLMLAGFNSVQDNVNNSSSLDIPGGLRSGTKRVVTVILITPMITEGVHK